MNGIMARYSRSVLLVDDSPADRALFTRELQRAGFDVLATGSAEDAMSVIVGGGVGCLVTDEVMAVTGQELAAIAAGVRGDLCIVFISGAIERRPSLPPGAIFISKDEKARIVQAVADCMMPWRIAAHDE